MPAYAQITLMGNVGKSEVKDSANGGQYIRMTVAVNEPNGDPPTWWACYVSGVQNHAAFIKAFKPGRLVLLNGHPKPKAYLKTDGKAGSNNIVLVNGMPQLVDGASED